jgi:hypothetical protein
MGSLSIRCRLVFVARGGPAQGRQTAEARWPRAKAGNRTAQGEEQGKGEESYGTPCTDTGQ